MLLQSLLGLQAKHQTYYTNLFSKIDQTRTIASFPDANREKTLAEVYTQYKVKVPTSLAPFAKGNTKSWHYHNDVMLDEKNRKCKFKNKGQLLEVSTALDKALKEKLDDVQRAITLGFMIHLIQDLHQPLHNFTKLDSDCGHDHGGNDICVTKGKGGSCEQNLHQLWDSGFGVFDGGVSLPSSEMKTYKFAPEAWSYETKRYYKGVYDYKQKGYNAISQKIAAKQVSMAITRVGAHLKQHYALHNNQAPLLIKKKENAKK